MNNKAQAWGVDLMVGIIIFFIGIMIFFIYSMNYSPTSKDSFEKIYDQAASISEVLMSEGSPENWNETNVLKIGIVKDNKLEFEKIQSFYYLSLSDYNRTKILLNTAFDYYIIIDANITIGGTNISGIGKDMSTETENLVKFTRTSIYQNKPVSVNIYVWD